MTFIETAKANATRNPRRVILPEGGDARVLAAADIIAAEGFAIPVLFGTRPRAGCEVIDPTGVDTAPITEAIKTRRPKTTDDEAATRLQEPMTLAAGLVATGQADAMVAGAATATRDVIRGGFFAIGMAEGVKVASSFFVLLLPDRDPLFLADCALNIAPDAAALADIAVTTSQSATALTGQPARAALLSYSTHKSGAGDSVDTVRAALEIVRSTRPDLLIDGPLQADAALSARIAKTKGVAGAVAGQANTLIFPTLDAGNIGYKLLQELAGAQAIGPFLQGFAKPICDLSRGATVDDIVAATAITLSSIAD
jgi:phosphate acetyltransferase